MRRCHPCALAFLVLWLFPQQIVPQTQPSSQSSTSAASEDTKPKRKRVNCANNGSYVNSKRQTVAGPENCSAPPYERTKDLWLPRNKQTNRFLRVGLL
jgi:hypothetical protein